MTTAHDSACRLAEVCESLAGVTHHLGGDGPSITLLLFCFALSLRAGQFDLDIASANDSPE